MAFLFARSADENLAGLVKQLDKVVAENEDAKMAAVVNFMDVDAEKVKQFAEKHNIQNVALTVVDEENAGKFKISPDAEVTAMHYKGKKVLSNQAVAKGELDKRAIDAIISGTEEILKE